MTVFYNLRKEVYGNMNHMKKATFAVCATVIGVLMLLAAALPSTAAGNTSYIRGDANGDGQHDMRDVLVILRNLRFGDAVPRPVNADMNGNDRMDLPDAMLIWQYLCGWKIALQ